MTDPRKRRGIDLGGIAVWTFENGAFALGMVLMFSKTVDLMTAFAPRTIFGYTGLELYYGLAAGSLIEGALFVMKLTLPRAKNAMDWRWNVLVVIAPFLISALAQVFDSFLVRNTLAAQPAGVQVFVAWFVPSIPTLIIGLLVGKSIFSSVPAGMKSTPRRSVAPAPLPTTQVVGTSEAGSKPARVGRLPGSTWRERHHG